jgi:hypothetical protein
MRLGLGYYCMGTPPFPPLPLPLPYLPSLLAPSLPLPPSLSSLSYNLIQIWVILWHPWMDLIKFFCHNVLFKMNIPLLHPYSEADKKRDALLEKRSKNAWRSDDEENYSAIDVPNQDDADLAEEVENEQTQKEHTEEHGEEPGPSEKVAKDENEHNRDDDDAEKEHTTKEEVTEEGDKKTTEEKTKTDDEGEHKVTHEHTDKGDSVEHKVTEEHKDEEGNETKEETTGESQKGGLTPAPAPPSL